MKETEVNIPNNEKCWLGEIKHGLVMFFKDWWMIFGSKISRALVWRERGLLVEKGGGRFSVVNNGFLVGNNWNFLFGVSSSFWFGKNGRLFG